MSQETTSSTILLVDADVMFQKLFGDLFRQKAGDTCNLQICSDAGSALKWLTSRSASLICAELSLPVIDGIQFLGMVNQKYPAIRLCLLTSRQDAENLRRPNLRPGLCPFFLKPSTSKDWDVLVYHLGEMAGLTLPPPFFEELSPPAPEHATDADTITSCAPSIEGLDEIFCYHETTKDQESHGIAHPALRRQITDFMLIQKSILARLAPMGNLDCVELEDEHARALFYTSGDVRMLAKASPTGMGFGAMLELCEQTIAPLEE